MDVGEILEALKEKAVADKNLRDRLIATRAMQNPVTEFCKISCEAGLLISAMDLINYGEESYTAMRRSTNGGEDGKGSGTFQRPERPSLS